MIKNPYPGKFIVFEGLDGSGQSTQAELLRDFLVREGYQVILTKEPTLDSEAGKKIRQILDKEEKISPKNLQELFAQDRKVHLEKVIRLALKEDKMVISDRYFFSSFAYGKADGLSLEWLIKINNKFLLPDLTFILKVPPEVCLERIKKRNQKRTLFEKKEKLEKVWQTYKILPKKFKNVKMIEGEKSKEEVFSQIKNLVRSKLNFLRRWKMADFKVTLLGCTENPQTISVAGALGCFEEKSSAQLIEELQQLPEEQRLKRERGVLKNSFGRGHGSVGDQNYFIFSIEDLPRAATFQLCLPEYLAHLQQSLRRAKASRGFYLPEAIKNSGLAGKVEEILSRSFELYEKMLEAGIEGEDARFLLPLYTKTNIQTGGDARELCHLWQMSHREGTPSIVTAVVDEMIGQAKERAPSLFEDFGFNYETLAWYPSAQLYAPTNKMMLDFMLQDEIDKDYGVRKTVSLIDSSGHLSYLSIIGKIVEAALKEKNETDLANLKHIHFEFLVQMSLACLHQAIRQRSWNHTLESIYDAVQDTLEDDDRMVVPPSIKRRPRFLRMYQQQHRDMLNLYRELVREGIPRAEAIGVIPHSVKIYTLIHVNGWNAIHSIGQRTCVTAQWEIRKIAWEIARVIKKEFPALGKWAEPQCIILGGKCPEIEDCGYYKKKKRS